MDSWGVRILGASVYHMLWTSKVLIHVMPFSLAPAVRKAFAWRWGQVCPLRLPRFGKRREGGQGNESDEKHSETQGDCHGNQEASLHRSLEDHWSEAKNVVSEVRSTGRKRRAPACASAS